MEIIKKIEILSKRSQFAYQEYLKGKKYYQAKRIFNANKELLELLKEFQFVCDSDLLEIVYSYIFHLEDWFLQFEEKEKQVTNLEEEFVFFRFDNSFSFPSEFYEKIKS